MIQIKDVTKLYPAKESGNESANGGGGGNEKEKDKESGAIHALDHISLDVAPGEWLSIMGPSGSGKSTLVNLIGCLDRPSSGEIWLGGGNVAGLSSAELDRVRAGKIGLRVVREFHQQGRALVMVTHDPVVARLADRRIELHHGKIAHQEVFSMADEEQLDEVLEELWALAEHGEIAEVERMEVHGALPVSLAIEKMNEIGLVVASPHPSQPHHHKPVLYPCHQALKPVSAESRD